MKNKTNILIVEDNEDVRELIVFLVENDFETSITEADSGNKAIELLKENTYDIVISDFNMPNGNGETLYTYIIENKVPVKFILLSTVIPEDVSIFKTNPVDGFAAKPFFEEELTEHITKFINEVSNEVASDKTTQELSGKFVPIKIATLKRLSKIEFDLFIQLSNNKYIKVEKEEHNLDSTNLDHYHKKGMSHLFIPHAEAVNFSNIFKKELLTKLYATEMPITESFEALQLTSDVVHQISSVFGLTDELKDAANKNIQVVLNQISTEPLLKDLMEHISSNSESYFSAHCSLLTYVCSAIAHSMDWSSDVTLYKLTMASFLHDMSLSDTQIENKQSHILSIARNEFMDVSDVIAVKEHPETGAKTAESWPVIHPDVDQIIRQHHEKPDGSGFPNALTYTKIHPLAALFIIAETFVDHILLDNPEDKSFELYFKIHDDVFTEGDFKKIYQAFKTQWQSQ
ncbi:MAG: response regulator [Bdellovibrionaceae bacterium]|jgi:response regulator RpfG family c-di-GMP phosphodiesterase|nr:response regulator [Pseudobdellovibrionaceae bacterium]